MAKANRHGQLVKEIQKRYGATIDLQKSPGVLIEILRNYAHLVAADDPPGTSTVAVGVSSGTGTGGTGTGGTGTGGTGTGGTGTGGTGTGTSTVAVGITPPESFPGGEVTNAVILQQLQNVHRDVKALVKALAVAPAATAAQAAKKARR